MAPRRTHRGSSGPPSGGRRRGERKFRKAAGGKKSGSCSFSLPLIPVAISRAALVAWQTWGVR